MRKVFSKRVKDMPGCPDIDLIKLLTLLIKHEVG